MIRPESVTGCRDLRGLVALAGELGARGTPRPVRRSAVPAELMPPLPAGIEVGHAGRVGVIDYYVAEGAGAVGDASAFAGALARWNVVLKTVVLYRDSLTGLISIIGTDGSRRLRRLDVDPSSPRRDVLERIAELAPRPGRSAGEHAAAVERALEREGVGRRFFQRFRRDVAAITEELGRLHPDEDLRSRREEALLILSRILFLFFVQRRGWLDGNPSFLSEVVTRSARQRGGIFTGVFLPLFFGCLNTPVARRDPFAKRMGRIPYLNGGLFEPSGYEKRHPVIALDDGLVQRVLLETFERFAFTIAEDDEEGAHVDPEMLGHVFESLMAEDERSASGTYYTPRELVDVLVARAMGAWADRASGGRGANLVEWLLRRAPRFAPRNPSGLRAGFRRIRVLDPACGSGAFLVAALHALERIDLELRESARGASRAAIRRRIVAESLHGIDLKPEAVRLCELRLWLAVVAVHEGDPMEVEPLPNLDRNVLQGNTLLGPLDFATEARADLYREWSFGLKGRATLIDRYRTAGATDRPRLARALRESDRALAEAIVTRCEARTREEIAELETAQNGLFGSGAPRATLRESLERRLEVFAADRDRLERGELDFFAPEVHFAHVMREGGFDLVIGNPPWVRASRADPALRRALAERYPMFGRRLGGRGIQQGDLSLAFFEKALRLTAPEGAVSFLMPQKVATADYAARFRAEVTKSRRIVALEDWSDRARNLFDADTFPLVVVVANSAPNGPVAIETCGDAFSLPQKRLQQSRSGPWVMVRSEVRAVFEGLERRCRSFEEVFSRPIMGIKTGANGEFFVEPEIDLASGTARVRGATVPLAALVRVIRGRDLRPWDARGSVWMLVPEALANRSAAAAVLPAAAKLAYVRPQHFQTKVVWKDLSRGVAAAGVGATVSIGDRVVPLVPNQTLYCAETRGFREAAFAAAILNSTVAGAWLVARADRAKDFHFRYYGRTVSSLPVPAFDRRAEDRIVDLATRAAADEEVRAAIDRIVTEAYGVDGAELRITRRFLLARLGRGLAPE